MNMQNCEAYESNQSAKINTPPDCNVEAVVIANKHSRAFGIIIIVLFIGVLLSFLLNFGISAYLGTADLADEYIDGKSHESIFLPKFADTFYLSSSIRKSITYIDYYLFGRIPTNEVIIGDGEFLFPTYDAEHKYNYIADYYSQDRPAEAKLTLYYQGLLNLTSAYKELGVDCYVAVIPNAQTVYSEKMPEFMGELSSDTRLSSVSEYLAKHGVKNYINLSESLINAKKYGELYNNTEDSLNSRGAYYAYRAVLDILPRDIKGSVSTVVLNDEDLVQHSTTGKILARTAMLEDVIKNKTVSLSTDFVQKYQTLLRYDNYEMVFAKMQYRNELPSEPRIAFSFSNDWDRIIMIDYFSNTFGTTIYRTSLDFDQAMIKDAYPSVHVIFLNERNLYKLADGSLLP